MLHGLDGNLGLVLAALPEWVSSLWSILLLVFGFSLVIFVHELGHFLAAKWARVRVDRFAIGFGKELFGFTRGETRYSFNVLPLGGYVKMLGQEDFVVDKSGELKVKDNPDSFTSKPISKRMVIISAGVIMNLLFAAVAFAVVVMVGMPELPAIIGEVQEDSPAGRAGFQTGDVVKSINDTDVASFIDLQMCVTLSDPDEPLVFEVEREGKPVDPPLVVLPEFRKEQEIRQIGVGPGWNRRVASPTFNPEEQRLPHELQAKDELAKLLITGKPEEIKSLGPLYRALIAARGEPVDVVVKRPRIPDALTPEMCVEPQPDLETVEVPVELRALWVPLAYDRADPMSGSLLGMVPRLTVVAPLPKKSFDRTGVLPGDVIVKIGDIANPTHADLQRIIEENADKPVPIEVRRTRAANHGLAAQTVEFCVLHREVLIAAAREGPVQALAKAAELAKAGNVPDAEIEKLLAKLQEAGDAAGWRRWLEAVDMHKPRPIVPKRPFALFKKQPPKIDAIVACLDEDYLVVANVLDKLGERTSPAKAAELPRDVVILSAAGQPVSKWYQLSEVFRHSAGKTIDLTYRAGDEVRSAKIAVPNCISAALNLGPADRIVRIDGRANYPIKDLQGKASNIALPDWRAIEGLLAESIGKTVTVEYITMDGKKGSGEYAVTAENVDPWLRRVQFAPALQCFALVETNPVSNPITAAMVGFEKAYRTTLSTVQTLRHLIFTRQVGINKISGPVGIIRMGSQAAESSFPQLLFFLAVLSANLAVINFLPMPIVDGGLFLFLLLEKIRGEPVSIKTQVATQLIGIALIAAVFILVTYQDIRNWIVG